MTVYKCDRCGKILKSKPDRKIKIQKEYWIAESFCHEDIELCNKCYSEFKKFLKDKEVEDGQQE